MYEPLPPMAHHLGSRATRISDMTEALYWAIEDTGLRLPPRRDIARRAHVSEATISRRFRESRSDETSLVSRLVHARRRTYPRGYLADGWSRWLPEDDVDLQDARVWLACLALAAGGADVGDAARDAVCEAWDAEIDQLVASKIEETHAEVLHAALIGVSIRRALDPELDHHRAESLVIRLVDALQSS
ncbi:hypothetical protein GCM10023339_06430 [Alloalcanivorax gelatiniphagus]